MHHHHRYSLPSHALQSPKAHGARRSHGPMQPLAWALLLLQLLASFLPALADGDKPDAQLLLALKEALTAGDEEQLTTWSGRNPCENKWEGISCAGGEVTGM